MAERRRSSAPGGHPSAQVEDALFVAVAEGDETASNVLFRRHPALVGADLSQAAERVTGARSMAEGARRWSSTPLATRRRIIAGAFARADAQALASTLT